MVGSELKKPKTIRVNTKRELPLQKEKGFLKRHRFLFVVTILAFLAAGLGIWTGHLTSPAHYANLADSDIRAQHLRYGVADRLKI